MLRVSVCEIFCVLVSGCTVRHVPLTYTSAFGRETDVVVRTCVGHVRILALKAQLLVAALHIPIASAKAGVAAAYALAFAWLFSACGGLRVVYRVPLAYHCSRRCRSHCCTHCVSCRCGCCRCVCSLCGQSARQRPRRPPHRAPSLPRRAGRAQRATRVSRAASAHRLAWERCGRSDDPTLGDPEGPPLFRQGGVRAPHRGRKTALPPGGEVAAFGGAIAPLGRATALERGGAIAPPGGAIASPGVTIANLGEAIASPGGAVVLLGREAPFYSQRVRRTDTCLPTRPGPAWPSPALPDRPSISATRLPPHEIADFGPPGLAFVWYVFIWLRWALPGPATLSLAWLGLPRRFFPA